MMIIEIPIFKTENDLRMERFDKLKTRLERATGDSPYVDICAKYRQWLDGQNIIAETKDGWPTDEVYDDGNIQQFVDSWNS